MPTFYVEKAAPSIFDFSHPSSTSNASNGTSEATGTNDANSTNGQTSPPPPPKAQTKLSAYLHSLSLKPASAPSSDIKIDEATPLEALLDQGKDDHGLGSVGMHGTLSNSGNDMIAGLGLPSSKPGERGNNNNIGEGVNAGGSGDGSGGASGNPENDSFAYIESILESLAYLGKLSFALDSVLQRTPLEIYNLIESTVHEVDERTNDPLRRNSFRLARLGGASPKLLFSSTFQPSSTYSISQQQQSAAAAYSLLLRSSASLSSGSEKEDANAQATLLEMNTEILLDFFWTLFSKLDAVLQGFRVLNEVVGRITSVGPAFGVLY